jgi:alkanesulfonate monooxygenase SsuD/methylene tetrahydromethanopterin reductase-like flavin-dependent oxidoreductase (luciferase family)
VKFGIMNLFPLNDNQDMSTVINETLDEAVLADQLGFDSIWLAEHHFSPYGILGNPLSFGMAVAGRTERIEIGTAVMVLPFHNPLRLAEEAALLDVISKGRLRLGIGRGYKPDEFNGFGVRPEDSIEMYDETVDILRKAWSGEKFSHEGSQYQMKDLMIFPRPLTPGGPPILHGTVSPDSYVKRGLAGEHIITSPNFTPMRLMKQNFDAYKDALVEGGHNPKDFGIPFMQQVWCGGPQSAGKEVAAEAALSYYRIVGKIIPGSDEAMASEIEYYEKVRKNIELLTLEKTLTHGGNFGSVDEVVDTIGRLQEELGVNHYIGWFRIPSLDRGVALDAMETFATEVMPQFKEKELTSVAS